MAITILSNRKRTKSSTKRGTGKNQIAFIIRSLYRLPAAIFLLVLVYLWWSSTTMISDNIIHLCVSSRKLNNLYCVSAGTQPNISSDSKSYSMPNIKVSLTGSDNKSYSMSNVEAPLAASDNKSYSMPNIEVPLTTSDGKSYSKPSIEVSLAASDDKSYAIPDIEVPFTASDNKSYSMPDIKAPPFAASDDKSYYMPNVEVPSAALDDENYSIPNIEVPFATSDNNSSYSMPNVEVPSAASDDKIYSVPNVEVPSATTEDMSFSMPKVEVPSATSDDKSYFMPNLEVPSKPSDTSSDDKSYSMPSVEVPSTASDDKIYSMPNVEVPLETSDDKSYSMPNVEVSSTTLDASSDDKSYSMPSVEVPSASSDDKSYSMPNLEVPSKPSDASSDDKSYSMPSVEVPSAASDASSDDKSYSMPNVSSAASKSYSMPNVEVPSAASDDKSYYMPNVEVSSATSDDSSYSGGTVIKEFANVVQNEAERIRTSRNTEAEVDKKAIEEQLLIHRSWKSKNYDETCEGKGIYVYNLPSKFNKDLVGQCADMMPWKNFCKYFSHDALGEPIEKLGSGWYHTNQYALEPIFHAKVLNHPCRVYNTNEAKLFYIPFYGGLDILRWHFKNVSNDVKDTLGLELVKWLDSKATWKRNSGKDHVLVLGKISWDFRRNNDAFWGTRFLLLEQMQNPIKLLIERQPWHLNDIGIPHPTFFHPTSDNDISSWQLKIIRANREKLVSFAGADRPDAERNIRSILIDQCNSSSNATCQFLNCNAGQCDRPESVIELFTESEFCLQPPGDSPTRKSVFDSLISGCIPVLFDKFTAYYQYPWHLPEDHTKYSVFIDQEEVRKTEVNVVERLRNIPERERQNIRRYIVYELLPGLVYGDSNSQLQKFQDAFSITINNLVERVNKLE